MTDTKELLKRAGELADGDKPGEAVEICNRVLLDEPDHPGALYIIGCVLLKDARQVQGIQIAKRICEIAPKDFRGWSLLAVFWGELHRYDESIRCAEKALSLKRTDKTLADACYAHTNAGNWDLAAKYGEEALGMAHDDPSPLAREAMTNCAVSMGYIRLAQGRWKEGFDGYRATMRTKWRKERNYTAADGGDTKEWMGEHDARVIVTTEQGLGDEIMAAGVVPDAAARCAKFILDCDARLAPLFARSFPNVHVVGGRREETLRLPASVGLPTHHKTLFGLGEILRQTDADFPRQPYLVPDAAYVSMFKDLFGGQRTIGIAWSGGLPRTGEEPRTAGLRSFLPLVRRGDAEYISLQYRQDGDEVAQFQRDTGIRIRRLPWAAQSMDMDLLAGLLGACDEVIGVHTTAMHLASSMGVPTTILTHRGSGWRYATPEIMWYPPTTQMWRKHAGQSWRDCVASLVERRKERLAA